LGGFAGGKLAKMSGEHLRVPHDQLAVQALVASPDAASVADSWPSQVIGKDEARDRAAGLAL